MNTRKNVFIVCLLALASSLPGFAEPAAPRTPAPTPAEPKPYTLFMGSDLSVEWEGKPCLIKGVNDKGFLIDVGGRRVTVSSDRADLKINGKQALKVAPSGIAVTQLEIGRAYTPANDPKRAAEAAANAAAGMAAKIDSENYQLNIQRAEIGAAYAAKPSAYGPSRDEKLALIHKSYSKLVSEMLVDQGISMAAVASPTGGDASGKDTHDAFRLSCDITAKTPAKGVYLMLVVHFREPADKANPERIWILGQEIGDLGPKAKAVRMLRGGFPSGYVLVGTQVHLYSDGTELASDVAPKHVEITADEAFQIAVADYVTQHRNADAQPVKAGENLPAVVKARLSAGQLGRTYYVKVGRSGLPQGGFLDEACSQKISEEPLAAALSALRFYPALKAGKPVESVAPVRF